MKRLLLADEGVLLRLSIVMGVIFAASFCALAGFEKDPYLIYPGDPSEMWLVWQSDGQKNCTVELGLADSHELPSRESYPQRSGMHIVRFNELLPGRTYYYRVTQSGETRSGSFNTAPEKTSMSSPVMVLTHQTSS